MALSNFPMIGKTPCTISRTKSCNFGSKEFLYDEFKKFLLWINGKLGTPSQRELSKKVKYIIMTGDIVEGVGVYPGQENDLEIEGMKDQYEAIAKYFKKIPEHERNYTPISEYLYKYL